MRNQTAVIENLIDAETGRKAVKTLIIPVYKNPLIKSLHVLGQPASGKTTIIGQFIESIGIIGKKTHIHLKINTTFFDRVQAASERKTRKSDMAKLDSKFWDKNDWKDFETMLTEAILDPLTKKPRGDEQKVFLTVETPYILYWEKQNNGREILGNISKLTPYTFYLYVVGDKDSILKTANMRLAVVGNKENRPLPSQNLVKKLEQEYQTYLISYDNSEKSGREIKKIFKRMAPREAVIRIQEKTKEIIEEWSKTNKNYKKYMRKIYLPKVYNTLPANLRLLYKKEAAYMLYVFREELNLPPERSRIVFNPKIKDQKIYMYLKLLNK